MDHDAYLKQLDAELRSLQSQMRWFNRIALGLGVASFAGLLYAWWVPLVGICFSVSLGGVAMYIGNVHLQHVREQMAALNKESAS